MAEDYDKPQSDGYIDVGEPETRNCEIKLRVNPVRRREKVFVGCGAGFGGDRPLAALKLLQKVDDLNYLVLECLAERTLADRYQAVLSGGEGFDPRISEWMQLLLPLAVEKGVCIITNMGATNALAAQEKVLEIASRLGIKITVGVAHQFDIAKAGLCSNLRNLSDGISMYLGAAPIVECLEKYNPDVVITSRVADAALFLAPMVYELGWNWDDFPLLAQGSLAGHLLECGCQLTGGYFMHPGDKYRNISCANLLDLSLPFAEVNYDGNMCVAKADGSGGVLNFSTCAQQLLYEVGDPGAYITPDVVIDFQDVSFHSLSTDKVVCTGAKPAATSVPDNLLALASKEAGWKGWGEISYGGYKCVERAKAAEYLVKSWMEEVCPGTSARIMSYIIGLDSLKATSLENYTLVTNDIRLRMDGLFEQEQHAIEFTKEFTALYTNGPAGGGGISTGHKKEILLEKGLVGREHIYWKISAKENQPTKSNNHQTNTLPTETKSNNPKEFLSPENHVSLSPAPSNEKVHLYDIAHSRAGDKGNDVNFSLIPYFPPDIKRLKTVITPDWVKRVVSPLLNQSSFPEEVDDTETRDKWVDEHVSVEIYEVRGISSLNVVVRNILDGGVNCSRRIDRHGKTISDLILCQEVVLPM
ncbi:uncharacterized protein LOC110937671 isoform X1 [Helianthus annuus]|uniref:Uncharacterized protein n=1 Tax=Helianthus annuus TaxID=4232 RepID=A0A251V2P5_HELAN|nr:uncharacterized protein LOC110937671 isoform X1 [Helianthus annuus]